MKPKDFTNRPIDSVMQQSEAETVARNIMVILYKTGNDCRKLKFSEYKKERKKDGGYSDMEETYFKKVIKYCGSEEAAKTFSPCWNKA